MDTVSYFIVNTLMYSSPLIFAALGGVICERSGVINIGIEGMMTVGAFAGAAVGYFSGSAWLGFLCAGIAGALLATFHAIASITFRADQTISGVAINLIGPGFSLFISRLLFDGATMTLPVPNKMPKWFGVDSVVIIAFALAFIMWFVLYKTKWGLRLLAVGEHPAAADTLGINVYVVRYVAVILSGFLAGLGGGVMTLSIVSLFSQTVISGQGFIALAAVIFGNWTPQGALKACLLFGFAKTLEVMLGGGATIIPSQILAMMPYILTILVLVLFVGRSRAPKASGVPYKKGVR